MERQRSGERHRVILAIKKSLLNNTMQMDGYYRMSQRKCAVQNVDENQQDYKIIFKFVVIDKYDQVYVFPVSEETLLKWTNGLREALTEANYHYSERKYELPYVFANGNVTL